MNIDRKKLEKLFDEHFMYESSNEVFDAMDEIIDYAEKVVKLFAIPDVVGRSEQLSLSTGGCYECPKCGKSLHVSDYDHDYKA